MVEKDIDYFIEKYKIFPHFYEPSRAMFGTMCCTIYGLKREVMLMVNMYSTINIIERTLKYLIEEEENGGLIKIQYYARKNKM